jgi:hypothetical protein
VNDAALSVPLVLAVESDDIANFEVGNSRSEVDVVRNEQCLTRWQLENETLMTIAVVIICKYAIDNALTGNLDIAPLITERAPDCGAGFAAVRAGALADCGGTGRINDRGRRGRIVVSDAEYGAEGSNGK